MATPEGRIKSALDRMFKQEGVFYQCPQAGPFGTAGWPDRQCLVNGWFIGVECKSDAGKKLTPLQQKAGRDIEKHGGLFFVVYDKETIEEVRRKIRDVSRASEAITGAQTSEPPAYTDGIAGSGEV